MKIISRLININYYNKNYITLININYYNKN